MSTSTHSRKPSLKIHRFHSLHRSLSALLLFWIKFLTLARFTSSPQDWQITPELIKVLFCQVEVVMNFTTVLLEKVWNTASFIGEQLFFLF